METLEHLTNIERALLALRDEDEARRFLSAIFSLAEYEKIRKRWQVYQLRAEGMSLAEIVSTARVAIATATCSAAIRRSSHRGILDIIMARVTAKPGVPIIAERYELSDAEWQRIADLLPGKSGERGPIADNRTFVNAVLWVLRSGARWQDLPERYGKWNSIHKRFTRWAKSGGWESVFASLTADPDNQYLMLDTTLVRVRQLAAGGKEGPKCGSGMTLGPPNRPASEVDKESRNS